MGGRQSGDYVWECPCCLGIVIHSEDVHERPEDPPEDWASARIFFKKGGEELGLWYPDEDYVCPKCIPKLEEAREKAEKVYVGVFRSVPDYKPSRIVRAKDGLPYPDDGFHFWEKCGDPEFRWCPKCETRRHQSDPDESRCVIAQ